MDIFVKKLSSKVNGAVLDALFAKYGKVLSAKVIYDRITGESRGFGFVSMANDEEAKAAIEALNGHELDGNILEVSEAEPPTRKFKIRM